MRDILYLAHRVPWPPDRGDKIRSYNVLKHLSGLARVHLVAFADDAREALGASALEPLAATIHVEPRDRGRAGGVLAALLEGRAASLALFDSRALRRRVNTLLESGTIGTVFAFSGQMAQFVPPRPDVRFIMDFVDVDSAKFAAYAARGPLALRWLYRREARLLGQFELEVARHADASLFVSEAEAALFRSMGGPADRVYAIENGVDLESYVPRPCPREELIVFTGQMDYPPNIDAVRAFVGRVLPVLRRRRPRVRFAIVGRNPVPEVTRLAHEPGVIVTGEVADVRPWLARADVVAAPLAIARGVQNKVLEAMAMGRPVVASPAAAEGIAGDGALRIAEPDAMASAILDLLDNPDRAEALGTAARARMEQRYCWQERLAPLTALLGG